jgi:hypothetical protein
MMVPGRRVAVAFQPAEAFLVFLVPDTLRFNNMLVNKNMKIHVFSKVN